jgi:uncharacterized membrane protein YphA (DoxX/SURF4 family)
MTSLAAAVLGVAMIAIGLTKVMGAESQAASFAGWGLPPWFRMLVGTFEIVGGALMAIPATSPLGSVILSTIMVGALWTHIANGEWMRLASPAVLLVLFLLLFRASSAQAVRLLGGRTSDERASLPERQGA